MATVVVSKKRNRRQSIRNECVQMFNFSHFSLPLSHLYFRMISLFSCFISLVVLVPVCAQWQNATDTREFDVFSFCSLFFPPAATIFHYFAMHNSKSGLIYLVQLLFTVMQENLFCFFELMAYF